MRPPPVGDVSVVITTTGRPELRRAIESALDQVRKPLEILVVNDSQSEIDIGFASESTVNIRVLSSGGAGANGARNLGIAESRGEFIALLDDDDFWFPNKLERQLEILSALPRDVPALVTCLARSDARGWTLDRAELSPVNLAYHLFCRKFRPVRRGMQFQTSGLMFNRGLRDVGFAEGLRFHQDWDWLVRVARLPGLLVVAIAEELYHYSSPAVQNISRKFDLQGEQQWALQALAPRSRELFGYFVTVGAPRSLMARDFRAFLRAYWRAFRYGRPHLGTFVSGLGELLGMSLRWIGSHIT